MDGYQEWKVDGFRYTYDHEGLIADALCTFTKDERFIKALNASIKEGCFLWRGNSWRIFVACWAGEHAKNLEGDFVECGVDKGMLARTMFEYSDLSKKKFYLIDTYTGVDQRFLLPEEIGHEAYYGSTYEEVKQT